jgi:hypothetical protein
MKAKGFEIQLSTNVKDGVSGMRIVMEKDKNPIQKGFIKQVTNFLKLPTS